jgi:hypothetical protein
VLTGLHRRLPSTLILSAGLFLVLLLAVASVGASKARALDPGAVSTQYKVGYQESRILDSERPRIVNGGRILKVSVWYPVRPKDVGPNPTPAKYDGGWLLPGDFIPDNEVENDLAPDPITGVPNLTAEPPSFSSSVALDGSNLAASPGEFPLVVITPSATIPVWTFASGFAETAASHGLVLVSLEALIGDGWRTRLGFGPIADSSNLTNRTEDIRFVIDLMTNVNRWTGNGQSDPPLTPPNNFPKIVALRSRIDPESVGILTASGGGGPMFEYATLGDLRLKALVGFHTAAFTLTPERLAQVKVPVMFESGELDTNFPPSVVESSFQNIGTKMKDKYLVETLGATHFDGVTCAAADGLYRPSAALMTSTSAKNLSNLFANIYDSLCLNQTDISSQEVGEIAVRGAVAMFKWYLGGDGRYKPFLLACDANPPTLPKGTQTVECP